MSAGNPIVSLRIARELVAEIDAAVATLNRRDGGDTHTRATWVLGAVREKLAHLRRGRKDGRPAEAKASPAPAVHVEPIDPAALIDDDSPQPRNKREADDLAVYGYF